MMEQRPSNATHLYALRLLDHVGDSALRRIAEAYPLVEDVLAAPEEELARRLGTKLARILRDGVDRKWPTIWAAAEDLMARQAAQGIVTLTRNDHRYPPLLQINNTDAPVLLHVRGNIEALSQLHTVAVVGTREATERGIKVAQAVAGSFASHGFAVISGLAKGIDTAAHRGTLERHGVTIAVLATGLDTIYPAQNKDLAQRICAEGGALVSEYPLGSAPFRAAFVRRDRIQAALALGVVVVQTGVTGGTMHTIGFAEQYGRAVLCPQPLEDEASAPQYEGVWELLRTQRARPFHRGEYDDIMHDLADLKQRLLSSSYGSPVQSAQEQRAAPTGVESSSAMTSMPRQQGLWGSIK